MTYDIEDLLTDLEILLKANLNSQITALNSEKNDTIVLRLIDEDAWFYQTLDSRVANYDPIVHYGIVEFIDDDTGNFGHSQTKVIINIVICVADQGLDVNISKRMFRYQRALKEVVENNFDRLPHCKMQVKSKVPVDVALINSSFTHKAIGVSLEVNFG